MIKCLLDKNADPSAKNSERDTPLHAIINQQAFTGAYSQKDSAKVAKNWKKAAQERVSCVVALLAYGRCDPNCQNREGMTPLHLAVEVLTHVAICTVKLQSYCKLKCMSITKSIWNMLTLLELNTLIKLNTLN